MKKIYVMVLIGMMSLMLVACGKSKNDDSSSKIKKDATKEEKVTTEEQSKEDQEKKEEKKKEKENEDQKTVKYQLKWMESGFYGGIAWAKVEDDTGLEKYVLINKKLQVVHELPEGMEAGDIFNGKAVAINKNQKENPGFYIIGADGEVLYESSDELPENIESVSLTKDGGLVYEKRVSGLTENAVYACILNDKFKAVAQIELPFTDCEKFYYLSDGVYCSRQSDLHIINVADNKAYEVSGNNIELDLIDIDRCIGLRCYFERNVAYCLAANIIDFNGIVDQESLLNLAKSSGKFYSYYDLHNYTDVFFLPQGYFNYTVNEDCLKSIEGVVLPDFGADILSFRVSNDGKYYALLLMGADGEMYYTVIDSTGKNLYEPMAPDYLNWGGSYSNGEWCVCDGYILDVEGQGITPDGKYFEIGDGTSLSGIKEDSAVCIEGLLFISDGYIVFQDKLYKLDGTEVTTVTAKKS